MNITYISGTRADYELMRPVLFAIEKEQGLQLNVLTTGMHLREKYGQTVNEIVEDGFKILDRIDTLHDEDTGFGMTECLGRTILGFAKALRQHPPDLLLLLGDRDEQLAGALVGAHTNILVAQVHAGERSGSVDESNRHAISRFAHVHFVANEDSKTRLIRMGEEEFRVHVVGAPAIDELQRVPVLSREDLSRAVGVDLVKRPYLVLLQHSVTTEESQAESQIQETLAAIKTSGLFCVALAPNSDAGGARILSVLRKAQGEGFLHLILHLKQAQYASLLKHARAMVGNSSSGIIEAPFLEVPVVNVGNRQALRFHGCNVIHVPHDRAAILDAIRKADQDQDFRKKLKKDRLIYGNGTAAEKTVHVLKALSPGDPKFLAKRLSY